MNKLTKLNQEIVDEALKTGEPIWWSFDEGNRNIVSVGRRRWYRVRARRFHADMGEAGFEVSNTVNRFYFKSGVTQ